MSELNSERRFRMIIIAFLFLITTQNLFEHIALSLDGKSFVYAESIGEVSTYILPSIFRTTSKALLPKVCNSWKCSPKIAQYSEHFLT